MPAQVAVHPAAPPTPKPDWRGRTFVNRTSLLWTAVVCIICTFLWYLDLNLSLGSGSREPWHWGFLRFLIMVPGFAAVTYLGCTVYFLQRQAHERSIAEAEVAQFLVLGRLAASIAHEVRNPLNNIKLLLEELAAQHQDAQDQHLLRRLDTNVGRINHAVELVYRLARPGEVRQRLEGNDYTELIELVEEVRATLPAAERERLICINKTGRSSVYGCGDHGSLQTILENLIRNACRASKTPPVYVDLDLDGERSLATLTIYNEGRLPEDFSFGDIDEGAPTTKQVRGLGLGVLIVRQLAKQMQIHLRYTSDDGVVTFVAEIPLHLGLFARRDSDGSRQDTYDDNSPARIDCR